jgi:integrase
VRITVGWQDGKQIRKYLGYYKSEAEALIALAEYHKNGYDIDLSKLTLGELYDRWISRIEENVSENVLKSHRMTHRRFGRLMNVPIVNIKADQLQDWIDNITDVAPATKKRMKSTMMQLWKYAIKNDIVSVNYAEYIEIKGKTEKKGKIFTPEEIKTLWDDVDNPVAQWILILIYSGMRIGELLLLTKDDIYLDKKYAIGGLKSEAGKNRVIPIHNATLQLVEKTLGNNKYLMRNMWNNKLSYASALEHFKDYMTQRGWSHLPHDTRKTAVSLMHSAKIPIETIRIIVGHSAKGVTESVYLYKSPEELVEEINRVTINTKPLETSITL